LRRVEGGEQAYLRPPGALAEKDLIARCIRCNQCGDVCKNRCIQFVPDGPAEGTPMISPREQACILCMNCNHACPTGALGRIADDAESILAKVRMGTAQVDKNICNSYNGAVCGVCIQACPFTEEAIETGLYERPIVHPETCVGCGLCEKSCIVYPQAIRVVPISKAAPPTEDRA